MTALVLINAHARRGSEKAADYARSLLSDAEVVLTRTFDEARAALDARLSKGRLDLVVAGGGDGTAVSIINELRARVSVMPKVAVLPLGTGNAWANVTNAPKYRRALKLLSEHDHATLPTQHFPLIEVEGRLTPFAGAGWDADILSDYQAHKAAALPGAREANTGIKGYLGSMFTRTIPRLAIGGKARRVRVVNLDPNPLRVGAHLELEPMAGVKVGDTIYEGTFGVAGAGTLDKLGGGFRAFPYALLDKEKMAVRVYAGSVLGATMNMPRLWRGVHPLPNSHDWMLSHCRFELETPAPFEVGGDVLGERDSVEFKLLASGVHCVDWGKLQR